MGGVLAASAEAATTARIVAAAPAVRRASRGGRGRSTPIGTVPSSEISTAGSASAAVTHAQGVPRAARSRAAAAVASSVGREPGGRQRAVRIRGLASPLGSLSMAVNARSRHRPGTRPHSGSGLLVEILPHPAPGRRHRISRVQDFRRTPTPALQPASRTPASKHEAVHQCCQCHPCHEPDRRHTNASSDPDGRASRVARLWVEETGALDEPERPPVVSSV